MQLTCEVCKTPLRAANVRLDLAVAICHVCNAVHDLSGRKVQGLTVQGPDKPKLVRGKAPLPAKFKVEDDGVSTRITWQWFNSSYIFLIFFCIVWDGILLIWYGAILMTKGTPLMAFLLPIVHVAVGAGLTYYTLTRLMNCTRIEVSRDELTIRHGPLPWRGNMDVPGRQFTQLYGVEYGSTHYWGYWGARSTYALMALDRSGRAVKLISGLTHKDQVLYLEQALERRLGIEDTPVDGEVATRTCAV